MQACRINYRKQKQTRSLSITRLICYILVGSSGHTGQLGRDQRNVVSDCSIAATDPFLRPIMRSVWPRDIFV